MTHSSSRFIALLVISVLLLDPATASVLHSSPFSRQSTVARNAPFDSQALTLTLAAAAFYGAIVPHSRDPFLYVFGASHAVVRRYGSKRSFAPGQLELIRRAPSFSTLQEYTDWISTHWEQMESAHLTPGRFLEGMVKLGKLPEGTRERWVAQGAPAVFALRHRANLRQALTTVWERLNVRQRVIVQSDPRSIARFIRPDDIVHLDSEENPSARLVSREYLKNLLPYFLRFDGLSLLEQLQHGSSSRIPQAKPALNTPIVWRGLTVDEIPSSLEFRDSHSIKLAGYLYPGSKRNDVNHAALHFTIQDMLEAYRLLREEGPATAPKLWGKLKSAGWTVHVPSVAVLERGLEWLDMQGFPLRKTEKTWSVNGIARTYFYTLDTASWTPELRQRWRALANENGEGHSSKAIGGRIRILTELLHDLYHLTWNDLRAAAPTFTASPEETYRWANGINEANDSTVYERARGFGIAPERLMSGNSRYAPLTPTARAYLAAPERKRGERLRYLRQNQGLLRSDVIRLLEARGLSWGENAFYQFEEGYREELMTPAMWPALGEIVGHSGLLLLAGHADPQRAFATITDPLARRTLARLALGYPAKTQTSEQAGNIRLLAEERQWPDKLKTQDPSGINPFSFWGKRYARIPEGPEHLRRRLLVGGIVIPVVETFTFFTLRLPDVFRQVWGRRAIRMAVWEALDQLREDFLEAHRHSVFLGTRQEPVTRDDVRASDLLRWVPIQNALRDLSFDLIKPYERWVSVVCSATVTVLATSAVALLYRPPALYYMATVFIISLQLLQPTIQSAVRHARHNIRAIRSGRPQPLAISLPPSPPQDEAPVNPEITDLVRRLIDATDRGEFERFIEITAEMEGDEALQDSIRDALRAHYEEHPESIDAHLKLKTYLMDSGLIPGNVYGPNPTNTRGWVLAALALATGIHPVRIYDHLKSDIPFDTAQRLAALEQYIMDWNGFSRKDYQNLLSQLAKDGPHGSLLPLLSSLKSEDEYAQLGVVPIYPEISAVDESDILEDVHTALMLFMDSIRDDFAAQMHKTPAPFPDADIRRYASRIETAIGQLRPSLPPIDPEYERFFPNVFQHLMAAEFEGVRVKPGRATHLLKIRHKSNVLIASEVSGALQAIEDLVAMTASPDPLDQTVSYLALSTLYIPAEIFIAGEQFTSRVLMAMSQHPNHPLSASELDTAVEQSRLSVMSQLAEKRRRLMHAAPKPGQNAPLAISAFSRLGEWYARIPEGPSWVLARLALGGVLIPFVETMTFFTLRIPEVIQTLRRLPRNPDVRNESKGVAARMRRDFEVDLKALIDSLRRDFWRAHEHARFVGQHPHPLTEESMSTTDIWYEMSRQLHTLSYEIAEPFVFWARYSMGAALAGPTLILMALLIRDPSLSFSLGLGLFASAILVPTLHSAFRHARHNIRAILSDRFDQALGAAA